MRSLLEGGDAVPEPDHVELHLRDGVVAGEREVAGEVGEARDLGREHNTFPRALQLAARGVALPPARPAEVLPLDLVLSEALAHVLAGPGIGLRSAEDDEGSEAAPEG